MAVEDIIFGKNRHMFGGIEPSNMRVFEAVRPIVQSGVVSINVRIPEDTVIDGQTLCTVAGAVIVRRYDRYPMDEFDGDIVCTITDTYQTTIQDFPMSTGEEYKTCFYAAFPYTTLGVYNRNAINRVVINSVNNLERFGTLRKYYADTNTSSVTVMGTFVVGEDIKDTKGVMIRKSVMAHPTDITDGELVADIIRDDDTDEFVYDDFNVDNEVTYYYSAFTYDYDNIYNTDTYNRSSCLTRTCEWFYGFDIDTNDSNPQTRVTYPSDVDNAYYTPVSHTGDSDPTSSSDPNNYAFSYGDWVDCGFMPKPCMFKLDGTVLEYLDPNDYTKTITGEASKVSYLVSGSVNNEKDQPQAMMEWGKIWTKRWEDEDGIYHFRCASEQLDSDYDCWCNYDKDNNQIDNFYTSIYPIHENETVACWYTSISNHKADQDIYTENITNRLLARKWSGWSISLLADRLLIQDLLVLIGKSTDTQTVFGAEKSIAWNDKNGLLDKSGLFGKYGNNVKVFGMENWWNLDFYVYGWGINNRCVSRLKITPGTHDGSTQVGFERTSTIDTSKWIEEPLGTSSTILTSSVNGYIKSMKTYPYGRLPCTKNAGFGGSSSTYECDGIYIYQHSSATTFLAAITYSKSDVLGQGAFAVSFNEAITAGIYSAQRLSYKANSTAY